MKTTVTIAGNYGLTPFALFDQDVDEMVMFLNFLIETGKDSKKENTRVTSKTKDGFWDF